MCAICGVYLKEPGQKVAEPQLRRMRDAMAHRGPDGEGLLIDGPVGLGHRRLSIIDLAGGAQPIWNEDNSACVILNGEIYNYKELRSDLAAHGHRFRTQSDTEVIIHLYEDEPEQFVEKLNGMFAFAIWDRKSRSIVLGRDPFGIKPLYLLEDSTGLRFASEIKALFAFDESTPEPDPLGLADVAIFQYPLEDRTLFRGVRSLPPGSLYRCHNGDGSERRYWSIPMGEIDAGLNETAAAEKLLWLLEDSVRLQLRSDVPVGCHLSGGMDTAALVCLARRHLTGPLHTFSAGFAEGGIYDDQAHARISVQSVGSEHHIITPTADDFSNWFGRLIRHLDQPVAGPGLFPQFFVSQCAKERVKVVLGGQGADEMMGGYTRTYLWLLERHLQQAVNEEPIHSTSTLEQLLGGLPQLRHYGPLVKSYFSDGWGGDPAWRYFTLIRRQPDLEAVFSREFIGTLNGYNPYDAYRQIFNRHPKAELINRALYFETTAWLPALLQVEDRMSMACSLESRVPFLDRRIAELLFRLPARVKFGGGRTKAVLRRAMQGIVPQQILDRTNKIGFPVPLKNWFDGSLQGFLDGYFKDGRMLRRGIFRTDAVEQAKQDETGDQRARWGLLCLEAWFRAFIDSDRPQIREEGTAMAADRSQ